MDFATIWGYVWSILVALLVLGIMVMVHEYGHYKAGKLLGFGVQEFAIGMGPKIWKKERKGTLFTLRLLPIGGMCKFYGEDEAPADEKSFNAQKPWKRLIVIFSGPFMNLVLAIVLAITTVLIFGNIVPYVSKITNETGPAAVAGLEPGDRLVSVNGERLETYNASQLIGAAEGGTFTITVERDGEKLDLTINDAYDEEAGRNYIGIEMVQGRKYYGFFESVGESFHYVGEIISEMFGFFGSLFRGQVQEGDVMGTVRTVDFISQAVRASFEVVMRLGILLCINLAIINLLPIPALDGGRLVFILIEMVRGKPIAPEKEGMVHFVGLMLLFGLIIFLTYSDIKILITGG